MMNKYEGVFNGGPEHGQRYPFPKNQEIIEVTKVYESGLTTVSKYARRRVEGNVIYYDLMEEKFLKYASHLERNDLK
jgi:hypothetical protein